MKIGGYVMVDCGGLDLTTGSTPVTIDGIYQRAADAMKTGKPIVAENLVYGSGNPLTPVECFGWVAEDGTIIMVSATIHVHISEDDSVITVDVAPTI